MRMRTVSWLIVVMATGLLLASGRAEARRVLLSGPVSELYPVGDVLKGMGWEVTQVAPAEFAAASFAGFDAIWLNSATGAGGPNTFAGLASRKHDLIEFVSNGGNLLAEVKGLHSDNATSDYPFGEELDCQFAPGANVRILDPLNPVNAGLVNGGLSGWGFVHVYPRIGSFHAIAENYDHSGQFVTIVKQVGRGHLIYTGQELAGHLIFGGPHLVAPQIIPFVDNALSYPPCDMDSVAVPTGVDLLRSQLTSGEATTGQVTISQPAGNTGVVVSLTSTDPAVEVPSTVTVPPGSDGASFPVTTFPVEAPTAVTIIAGCTLTPPVATLSVHPGSAGRRANLLVDGSFEEPDATSSFEPWGFTYGLIPGYDSYRGTSIPGWQITRGTIDLVVYDWPAAIGRQSIDLTGSPGGATLEQSFPTEPGRDYLLTGYVSHNPFLSEDRADVLLNDMPFATLMPNLRSNHTDMKWAAFAYRFRATTLTTKLTVRETNRNATVYGTALDALSVRLDQPPSTGAVTPTGPAGGGPAAPTGLAVTAIGGNQASLIWDDNSDDETAFAIWRSTAGGAWARVGVVPPNVTTFTDTGLNPGTRYLYGVRATNDAAASLWSNGAWVLTLPFVGQIISPDAAPGAPTALNVTGVTADQVVLAWTDNSLNEAAFAIWRKIGNGDWTRVGVVPPNTTTFRDSGLQRGTIYTYRVRSTNQLASDWSNEVTATTLL